MRFRAGPLRASVALAAGFVAVRIVYRVLFHGADGTGPVLMPLPVWRLPAPFAHVEVLGPATAGGLADAALGALPIAVTILAFGLLNAVLDLPRLISRAARSGPLQGVARALSIAWAALPSLADAVRSARLARGLRGERAGIVGGARLLAPILERTLEHAAAVAAALELRGYAGRSLEGDCARPIVLHEAAAGFGAGQATVRVDDLALRAGALTVLTGATGSGKTTLLRALSGLHAHVDGGWLTGTARVVGHDRAQTPPRDLSRTVGVVLQHPRQAFATQRVADEIGLALELRGVASVLVAERVRELAARVGVTGLLTRELRGLSAGEATLVAIAAAAIEQPVLLLVDEPLADLDASARGRIVDLLGAFAHDAGMCVLVAEHRAAEFTAVADGWLHLADAVVCTGDAGDAGAAATTQDARPAQAASGPDGADSGVRVLSHGGAPDGVPQPVSAAVPPFAETVPPSGSDVTPPLDAATAPPPIAEAVLRAQGITVRHGDRVAVRAAALTLGAGEIVALQGPNGAGKSSLLIALATGEHAHRIALVPDDSDALFIRDTVQRECRRTDRRFGLPPGTTAQRFAALLDLGSDGLADRLARHPRDLSAGERRCLAITVQTARQPAVLLLDEPTRGLDPRAAALVAAAMRDQSARGMAVLFATHDPAFAEALAVRTLAMDAGTLTAALPPAGGPRAPGPHSLGAHSSGPRSPGTDPTPAPQAQPGQRERHPVRPPVPQPAGRLRRIRRPSWALAAANAVAVSAFGWPLVAMAAPAQAQAAVPFVALALAPLAVVLLLSALDRGMRSAHLLANLAVLAAIGAAIRIASTGVGGVEALFILLILAGRAFGARFGLLLGAASIALSALLWGGVGPWMPFQMFACGWVAAGAALLPARLRGTREIVALCLYGIAASYLFGLIMNLWFWPFAVGAGTGISYVPGGGLGMNLANFLVYSLLTSTLGWDTLRAVTTVVGLALVGRAILRTLRRAKPLASPDGSPAATIAAPRATVDA